MTKEDEILKELQGIRKLLEPKPTPPAPKGIKAEFLDFISKYKVLGMAVAFILAVYLGILIQALVNDLVMPLIQIATPGIAWEVITLGPFRIGHFIGALITFLIVALVIFLMVKMVRRWGLE